MTLLIFWSFVQFHDENNKKANYKGRYPTNSYERYKFVILYFLNQNKLYLTKSYKENNELGTGIELFFDPFYLDHLIYDLFKSVFENHKFNNAGSKKC